MPYHSGSRCKVCIILASRTTLILHKTSQRAFEKVLHILVITKALFWTERLKAQVDFGFISNYTHGLFEYSRIVLSGPNSQSKTCFSSRKCTFKFRSGTQTSRTFLFHSLNTPVWSDVLFLCRRQTLNIFASSKFAVHWPHNSFWSKLGWNITVKKWIIFAWDTLIFLKAVCD